MCITDHRTGEVFDFTRKQGVLYSQLLLPGGGTAGRADFWNKIEAHHKRKDAVVAREVEISLPRELTPEKRQEIAVQYAVELTERYGVAADIGMHEPDKVTDRDLAKNPDKYWEIDPLTGRRHNANWHAHILLSACSVAPSGTLGKKVEIMDPIHCQREKIRNMVERERERWAEIGADALEQAGFMIEAARFRVGHLTLPEQVDAARQRGDLEFVHRNENREPQRHLGPAASQYERRTGNSSHRRNSFELEASERLAAAKLDGELEREVQELTRSIIDLSGDLAAAKDARNRELVKAGEQQARQAVHQIKDIKSRQTTEGNQSHEKGRKSDLRIWTAKDHAGAFEEYELDTLANRSIVQAQSINDLRDLSSIDVVPGRPRGEVLLSSDAADQLANGKSHATEALRRSAADNWGLSQRHRDSQQVEHQALESPIVHSADVSKPRSNGLPRETVRQLILDQLMNVDLDARRLEEHEREKPSAPR